MFPPPVFYTFVNSKGSNPQSPGITRYPSFYTFVNSKGSKPSKGYISTSGFFYLPLKQEKNTPRVPYIFCRAGFPTDRDGNSPRLLSLIYEGCYFVFNTAIGSFVLSIPLYPTLFATTTNFPLQVWYAQVTKEINLSPYTADSLGVYPVFSRLSFT